MLLDPSQKIAAQIELTRCGPISHRCYIFVHSFICLFLGNERLAPQSLTFVAIDGNYSFSNAASILGSVRFTKNNYFN